MFQYFKPVLIHSHVFALKYCMQPPSAPAPWVYKHNTLLSITLMCFSRQLEVVQLLPSQ